MEKVKASQKSIMASPRVQELWREEDGFFSDDGVTNTWSWWCILEYGWQCGENRTSHTLHERTLREIADLVNNAIPYPDDPELKR